MTTIAELGTFIARETAAALAAAPSAPGLVVLPGPGAAPPAANGSSHAPPAAPPMASYCRSAAPAGKAELPRT
jgi:hypothetical protein